MNKPVLIMSAPIATCSGYGAHSRDIFASLLKMDRFDIKILSQKWGNTPMNALYPNVQLHQEILKRIVDPNVVKQERPDVWIQITVPNEFQPVGKYNIGITAGIETTACHQEWLQGINRMNLIIVPSQFSKSVFLNTSYEIRNKQNVKESDLICTVPIEVIFEGADTSVYYQTDNIVTSVRHELNKIKENFAFLYVGHWLKGDVGKDRKNTGMLVKVFLETFKNEPTPPALILKTSGATFSVIDRNEIFKKIEAVKKSIKSDKPLPNVYLLHGDLTPEEMNALYNHSKVKANVSFTRGEGFGRPLLEASLSGNPIIVSNWSGLTDFLHKDCNILIGGKLEDVHESASWDKVIIKEAQWFTIDYNQAANAMMMIFKNLQNVKNASKKQMEYSKENFSLNKMHDVFEQVFNRYIPDPPSQMEIKLPKLKKIELPKLKKVEDHELPKVL